MDNHCCICGTYLADTGRMICPKCEVKKCVFCGKPTKGDCICPKCEKTKMYERPSIWKMIWRAIKSTFKRK